MAKRGGFPGGMGGFPGGMNINKLMKEAKKMQEDMEKTQEELSAREFENSVGGGVVSVKITGEKIVKEIVEETGATTIKDMGKVMKIAKERIGTRADGKDISDAVKKILA